MLKIKTWFYTKLAKYEYRKVDEDVCCCGSSQCDADYTHSYVNAKQHAIDGKVKAKLS
jgi:hypothetical protein